MKNNSKIQSQVCQKNVILIALFVLVALQGWGQINPKLIPYRSGELWGYCTPDKKIVIKPQFEQAYWFRDGLALVANHCDWDCYDVYDGKYGFIDEKGKIVIPIQYDAAFSFYKGKAWVLKDEQWFQINTKGEKVSNTIKGYGGNSKWQLPEELENILSKQGNDKNYQITDEILNEGTLGYKSKNGITYWDDPETVFFIPLDTIHINKAETKIRSTFYREWHQGTQLKPCLVLIKYENQQLVATKYFPLELMKPQDPSTDYEYARFKILNPESVKPYILQTSDNEKILFAYSMKIPAETIKENILFNIVSKGIGLVSTDYEGSFIYYHTSPYQLMNPREYQETLEAMVKDIQKTGKTMKEQGDNQNVMVQGKDNPYQGKMLFDVMENVTPKDVETFLEYVSVRPFQYMGGKWKISEVFATWVVSGAPRVIKK